MISNDNQTKLMLFLNNEMDKKWETMGDPDREINQEDFDFGYYRALEDVLYMVEKM